MHPPLRAVLTKLIGTIGYINAIKPEDSKIEVILTFRAFDLEAHWFSGCTVNQKQLKMGVINTKLKKLLLWKLRV